MAFIKRSSVKQEEAEVLNPQPQPKEAKTAPCGCCGGACGVKKPATPPPQQEQPKE